MTEVCDLDRGVTPGGKGLPALGEKFALENNKTPGILALVKAGNAVQKA